MIPQLWVGPKPETSYRKDWIVTRGQLRLTKDFDELPPVNRSTVWDRPGRTRRLSKESYSWDPGLTAFALRPTRSAAWQPVSIDIPRSDH